MSTPAENLPTLSDRLKDIVMALSQLPPGVSTRKLTSKGIHVDPLDMQLLAQKGLLIYGHKDPKRDKSLYVLGLTDLGNQVAEQLRSKDAGPPTPPEPVPPRAETSLLQRVDLEQFRQDLADETMNDQWLRFKYDCTATGLKLLKLAVTVSRENLAHLMRRDMSIAEIRNALGCERDQLDALIDHYDLWKIKDPNRTYTNGWSSDKERDNHAGSNPGDGREQSVPAGGSDGTDRGLQGDGRTTRRTDGHRRAGRGRSTADTGSSEGLPGDSQPADSDPGGLPGRSCGDCGDPDPVGSDRDDGTAQAAQPPHPEGEAGTGSPVRRCAEAASADDARGAEGPAPAGCDDLVLHPVEPDTPGAAPQGAGDGEIGQAGQEGDPGGGPVPGGPVCRDGGPGPDPEAEKHDSSGLKGASDVAAVATTSHTPGKLKERMSELWDGFAQGKSVKELADEFGAHVSTIKYHQANWEKAGKPNMQPATAPQTPPVLEEPPAPLQAEPKPPADSDNPPATQEQLQQLKAVLTGQAPRPGEAHQTQPVVKQPTVPRPVSRTEPQEPTVEVGRIYEGSIARVEWGFVLVDLIELADMRGHSPRGKVDLVECGLPVGVRDLRDAKQYGLREGVLCNAQVLSVRPDPNRKGKKLISLSLNQAPGHPEGYTPLSHLPKQPAPQPQKEQQPQKEVIPPTTMIDALAKANSEIVRLQADLAAAMATIEQASTAQPADLCTGCVKADICPFLELYEATVEPEPIYKPGRLSNIQIAYGPRPVVKCSAHVSGSKAF